MQRTRGVPLRFKGCAVLLTGVLWSCAALAVPTREVQVSRLLAASGVIARTQSLASEVIHGLQRQNPDVPAALWTRFEQRVTDPSLIVALYAPALERHLRAADIRALLTFFDSPLGQRYRIATVVIDEDIRRSSAAWAMEFAQTLVTDPVDPHPTATQHPPTPTDPTDGAVRQLIRVSGALADAQALSAQMLRRLLEANIGDPLIQLARTRLAEGQTLADSWIPAYARTLAPEDIHALTVFYEGPVGRRWVDALPLIRTEVLQRATASGDELAGQVMREALGPLPAWALMHPERIPAQGWGH